MSRTIPDPLISEAAALIGDPTRAAMLGVLLDGRARTAKELASLAGVAPATASGHIAKMTAAGLVSVASQGRHRYVRLASAEVAEILERLMALAAFARPPRRAVGAEEAAFRHARSCYDHFAGTLSVELAEALVRRDVLRRGPDGFEPTLHGERWFRALGVDVARARASSRAFARCCLDWSERRDHLAGALGAALLEALLAKGHLVRRKDGRTLDVPASGRRFFAEEIDRSPPRSAAAGRPGGEQPAEQQRA
ncbi:ArsR/SmtB family transcription factor [Hansschlegelia zhihuaiae]|uniref:ArsR family transcriptional regulator n=1 Tax=Hansschlegelia zhihuaiae TaxID=405005 RepID=A0A4Q0MJZ5_9HYPH|nr:winged helix-turn-helix domain-containing protein [Hansschlegelia zhihuaiae]RXF73449.1 ArsR family transcriptional regulator [Hansschlegelia zhihuaiae]